MVNEMVQYANIKVLPESKRILDGVKLKYGLPSYTQTITLLAQQERFGTDFVETIAPKITKTIMTELFKLFFDLIRQTHKTPDQITLQDLINVTENAEANLASK
jgi:hypothetical protein